MIDQYVIFGILLKYIQGIRYIAINFFSFLSAFFGVNKVSQYLYLLKNKNRIFILRNIN